MQRLSKKEIKKSETGTLNSRFCWLMLKEETMPQGIITLADAREIVWIRNELRWRLTKLLGRNFYPPNFFEKKKDRRQ